MRLEINWQTNMGLHICHLILKRRMDINARLNYRKSMVYIDKIIVAANFRNEIE